MLFTTVTPVYVWLQPACQGPSRQVFHKETDRVGGGLTPAALPQHRTYGSVSGVSCLLGKQPQRASFRSSCRLSTNRHRPPPSGLPAPSGMGAGSRVATRLLPCSRREHARLSTHNKFSPSPLRFQAATTASADFCHPIPTPCDVSSTRQGGRSPRVMRATFTLMPVGSTS
jgi:hypothetical protein